MMLTKSAVAMAIVAAGLAAAQDAEPSLQIAGGARQLTLTAGDLAKMPRASVRTVNKGMETVYEGVWVHDALGRAGVPQGEELRGKALAAYIVAEAKDGYRVVFSLGELDPAIADNQILIADAANGKPLSDAQGRFRLVAGKDKRSVRSVRMLTKLEVVQLKN